MGGNTALSDTATVLPLLARLSSMALASPLGKVEKSEIIKACGEFEAEMMPRAFEWVKKSGGDKMVVRSIQTFHVRWSFTDKLVAFRHKYIYWKDNLHFCRHHCKSYKLLLRVCWQICQTKVCGRSTRIELIFV
jgi:hypothetical protein